MRIRITDDCSTLSSHPEIFFAVKVFEHLPVKITLIQSRNCSAGTKVIWLLQFYYIKTLLQT